MENTDQGETEEGEDGTEYADHEHRGNPEAWRPDGPPSAAVVAAVAAATDRDPADLPGLGHRVDADALDALLADPRAGDGAAVAVRFDWAEATVVVTGDGRVGVDGDAPAFGPAPTTAAEFQSRLVTLCRRAFEHGVSVDGGWDVRNGSDVPDWTVEVARVRKPQE